jgi:hypothetical protein
MKVVYFAKKIALNSLFSIFIFFHFLCPPPLLSLSLASSRRSLLWKQKHNFSSCFVSLMLLTLSLLYFAISRGRRERKGNARRPISSSSD